MKCLLSPLCYFPDTVKVSQFFYINLFYMTCYVLLKMFPCIRFGRRGRWSKSKEEKEYLKIMSEFKSDLKSTMTSQFACIYVAALLRS